MCIKSFFRKGYTDLKFTALNVTEGDAFLLEKGDWKCLFDAGENVTEITDCLVTKRKINRINLAICSHNDSDHTTGFIGLLSSKIKIDEIWLPGSWINIIRFVLNQLKNGNWSAVEQLLDSSTDSNCRKTNFTPDGLYEPGSEAESVDDFEKYMSDDYSYYDDYMKNPVRKRKNSRKWICIKNIMDIAKKAYDNGCLIKWFEPDKCGINCYVDYGFYALNAKPKYTVQKISSVISFMKIINITLQNIYSMAFEFMYNDIPVVRFSADSTCSSQIVNPYTESIIITAPHHGSCKNDNVYNDLHFNDDKTIWIKTHNHRVTVIKKFKTMKNKYCVKCSANSFSVPQPICFKYNDAKIEWEHQNGKICTNPSC